MECKTYRWYGHSDIDPAPPGWTNALFGTAEKVGEESLFSAASLPLPGLLGTFGIGYLGARPKHKKAARAGGFFFLELLTQLSSNQREGLA